MPTLPADERPAPPLWGNVSFLLMWTSVAASGFGDRVMMLAALTLLGATADNIQGTSVLAGINFFFFLPYLLLGMPGGWLADRLPRKWLMLACDEARAAVLLLSFVLVPAAGYAVIPAGHQWKVYAVMAAVGVFAAIFSPVRNAVVPQIVPLRQLQSANALLIGIAVIASLIGMVAGGRMIDPTDSSTVRLSLFVGCLFFAVSGTFFAFLRIQARAAVSDGPAEPRRRQPAVLPFLRRHRVLIVLIGVSMVVWGAAFVVYNAALALSRQQYGFADEKAIFESFTQFGAALGAGMLAGAAWVAWMNTRRESGAIGMLALLGAAVCTAALAWTPLYRVALVLAFGVGFFGNTTIICVTTLLQSLSPDYIRGRIMGVNSLASTATNVLVNFVIWRLPKADTLVIRALELIAGVLAAVAVGGLWLEGTRGPMPKRFANVLWRLCRAYSLVWHRLRWIGRHQIPHAGPVILAANHTAGIDPLLMQAAVPRTVRWLMLGEYRFRLLTPVWRTIEPIALDRNAGDLTRLREVTRVLRAGHIVGLFPEGQLQRPGRQLQPFQSGIAMLAVRTGAAIVPVWIAGTPRSRHILGHFLRPSRSTVVFGQPYRPDAGQSYEQITADLRARMLALAPLAVGGPTCPACGADQREWRGCDRCPECGQPAPAPPPAMMPTA